MIEQDSINLSEKSSSHKMFRKLFSESIQLNISSSCSLTSMMSQLTELIVESDKQTSI